jgi:Domain of unknown function (DUF4337)
VAAEELQELHEQAEHAKDDRRMAPVSLTMAILAVAVAVVSLLGHRAHTEEVLSQAKASDQWAYYQAKNIRRQSDQIVADLMTVVPKQDGQAVAKLGEKYAGEAERYQSEQKTIQSEAQHLEEEVGVERRRADRFDLGEVFLEVALVITSITLMSGKRIFWHTGIVLAIVGFLITATGAFTH